MRSFRLESVMKMLRAIEEILIVPEMKKTMGDHPMTIARHNAN